MIKTAILMLKKWTKFSNLKFQERSIYITTFYKMPKVLNKRQTSAVTVCAICKTNLISTVFNSKTRQ